jgi:hypothetical protein
MEPFEYNETVVALLNLMLIIGPLLIGWSWAGRLLAKRTPDLNVDDVLEQELRE